MYRLPSWKLCGGLDKSYKMAPPGKLQFSELRKM